MTGDLDAGARRALTASEGPTLAKQQGECPVEEKREGAALKMDNFRNPFDRKDFLLFMIPAVIIVFALWEGTSQ